MTFVQYNLAPILLSVLCYYLDQFKFNAVIHVCHEQWRPITSSVDKGADGDEPPRNTRCLVWGHNSANIMATTNF